MHVRNSQVYYASCPVHDPFKPTDSTTMLHRALAALAEVLEARFEERYEKKGGHNVVVVDWFAWFTSHVEESEREKKSKKMLACPLTTPMLLLHVFASLSSSAMRLPTMLPRHYHKPHPLTIPTCSRLVKERAAVLSEMSMVNTIEYRVECAILQALHAENELSVRFPIGLKHLIENWSLSEVRIDRERKS